MHQLTIALEQAQAGMRQALEHAEEDAPGWGETALNYLIAYAKANHEFPGFFVVMASTQDKSFPVPANPRAWGAIFTKACRMGIITDSGKTMKHPKRHACKAIIWRSLVVGA